MKVKPDFTGDIQDDLDYLIEAYFVTIRMLQDSQEAVAAKTLRVVVEHLMYLKGVLSKSRREGRQ